MSGARSGIGADGISALLEGQRPLTEACVLRLAISEVASQIQVQFAGHLLQSETHLIIPGAAGDDQPRGGMLTPIEIAQASKPYRRCHVFLRDVERLGISQHQLADRANVDRPTISRVFTGKIPGSERVILRCAAALMCDDTQLRLINDFLVAAAFPPVALSDGTVYLQ